MVTPSLGRLSATKTNLHVNPVTGTDTCLPFLSNHLTLCLYNHSEMPLNDEQRQSLEQLWAVTASSSDASRERDERLLRENGFDVQVSDPRALDLALLCYCLF